VMDEDDAERERGVTMDVATKAISTEKHDFVVLDAPGHADFVPSMITGAAAADAGILVVAATIGEFEAGFDGGGQTREHIILARGLGVSQLIVAVNKLDAVDWDETRFNEIKAKIEPFLLQSGFAAKRIRFVPISGLTGANVKSKESADKLYDWYQGSTLIDAMDDFVPAQRNVDKPLRIVVNDVYTEGNKGVTVRCRVVQGVVQIGEKIVVLPIGDEATVSKIEHGSAATENRYKYAMSGDTTEIVLLGIDIARLATGNIMSHPHWELRPPLKRKVKARIMVMDQLSFPIIRGAQVLLHMHSIDVPTVLSKLLSSVHPKQKNSQKEKPRVLTAGVSASVEMTFADKISIETYNDCRALGRFVLRRGGETVAIGIVERIL
jgi:elongation factor 1 alpha-like protein